MRVVSFVNRKGGCGKSTLALNLAVTAARRGERVAILDLDPQATVSGWFDSRGNDRADTPCLIEATRVDTGLERLAEDGFTLVLIDTWGLNGADTVGAVRLSDLCLVPIRPSVADVRATMPTIRALTVSGASYALVINQAPPRQPSKLPCRPNEGAVLPATLGSRVDVQYAFAMGLGVDEYAPNGKAASEVAALWSTVRDRMDACLAADTRLRA